MAVALGLSLKVVCFHAFAISILASSHLEQSADTYIVHMDTSAMPKPFSGYHAWYSSMLSSISDGPAAVTTSTTAKLIYSYCNSINGFTATLTPSELEALKRSPGYLSSTPDQFLQPHTTRSQKFLGLRRGSGAWHTANYGDGVVIGLVDSGIWPESASFKDEGMSKPPSTWKGKCVADANFTSSNCNNKIIGARYYNKGFLAKYPDETISMNSTRDIEGHGTHTSSTAAGGFVEGVSYFGYANGTAVGAAPRAWIAVYKAIWNGGIAQSDALAAIDQAIVDGVDILSLSFSFGNNSLNINPISIACFTAMEKGIFVAVSAGNDGSAYGTLSNGVPWATTVGAGTMDRYLYGILTLGNGVQIRFPSWYPGDHSPWNKPLVLSECDSQEEFLKFRGYIVVCKESYDMLSLQKYYAREANATAAIFITDEEAVSLDDTRTEFPSVFLLLKESQTVIDYINKSSNPRASMEFQKTEMGTKPAPTVDTYSSRGPSPESPYVLKPDILAPGTSILAAWPSKTPVSDNFYHFWYSDYNVLLGTSMATPHIAGVAALVKAVHPDWSPAAIRSALMTTADALDNTQNPIKEAAYNDTATALDLGAGQVNPNKALNPGLIYNASAEDYVQLICAMGFPKKEIRKITRSSYKCLNPSLDLNYPSFIAYFNGEDSAPDELVQVFHRTVTNVGEGRSSYTAKLTPLKGLKVKVEPKILAFKSKYEKLSYNLTLEGPKYMKEFVVNGHLSWVSDGGKYVVRSPIIATHMDPGHTPDSFGGF